MGDLKFKNEMQIDFKNDTFIFNFKELPYHKITSRRFPCLINENPFTSVGYQILEMMKLLESEKFDNWYTLRGAIAEHFVNEYLKTIYGYETLQFKPSQFKLYDQFNGKNDTFGGVIDIAITKPFRSITEVKGKSMKDLEKIENFRPLEEVSQGELLAFLSKVLKYFMAYVFFTELQEQRIKRMADNIVAQGLSINEICEKQFDNVLKGLGWTINDLTIKVYEYDLDNEITERRTKQAKDVFEKARVTGMIPSNLFTPSEVQYLKQFVKNDEPLDDAEVFKRYLEGGK